MLLGIISDIHEDIVSLKKTLKLLEKYNCDHIVCLGDITGLSVPYYAHLDTRDANECIKLIKNNCSISLAGNHDMHAIKKIPSYTAGIEYPENFYSLRGYERQKTINSQIWNYDKNTLDPLLTEESIEYLNSLPELQVLPIDGKSVFFSHFLYPDITGSLALKSFHREDIVRHISFIEKNSCYISFCGHAHIQGALIYTNDRGLKLKKLGKRYRLREAKCIITPALASGLTSNGFLVYDTNYNEIQIISLHSGKFKMNYKGVSRDNKFLFGKV
ncbi:MAG: metallophosphoesterase family protein [Bacteroidales bacterium]|nr:metallophosphoesterase family protein [Bacteroidales bacterium]